MAKIVAGLGATHGPLIDTPPEAWDNLGLQDMNDPRMDFQAVLARAKPGMEAEFESGVQKARPLFLRALGCTGVSLHRSIEKPQRYRLMVKWETLENHTVDFRGSENFTEWRGLVGQYFASPPEVEHTRKVVTSAS